MVTCGWARIVIFLCREGRVPRPLLCECRWAAPSYGHSGVTRQFRVRLPGHFVEVPILLETRVSRGLYGWCREGELNPQGTKYRRILSPLRLPVPPSRHFVEVPDSTAYFTLYVFVVCDSECETVQVSVKVFMDFHRFLSLAHEVLCGSPRATMSTWPSNNEDIRTRFYHPTHSQPHL